jgi:16S rRNA G966 N2-methylase RsmD
MNTLRTETVKINSLSLDPTNARRHDAKNLAAIEGSLKLFGQRKPIVVTGANIVVAGNGTLEAAKSLGWEEIAIVRTPIDWTPEQVKAYALADNRTAELAEWDAKVLADQLIELDAVGWDVAEFGFEPMEPPSDSEDDEPLSFDEDKPTRAKIGDHWKVGNQHILCKDSLDKKTYQNIKADLVYTDPPYGISVVKSNMVGADFGVAKKGIYSEVIGDESGTTAADSFNLLFNLYPKAKHIWWGANHYSNTAKLPNSSCWLIWNKRSDSGIVNTFADAELAWSNLTQPVRMHNQLWNGMIREGEHDKRVHPTQKPVDLAKWAISLALNNKDAVVLDCFAGSGSTLVACHRLDFIGYGIELDPKYVDVIIDRLEKETGLEAELLES